MGYVGAEHALRRHQGNLVPGQASWLVTNGQAVVGPVSTQALLRGIERRVVTSKCLVRQPSWAAWRAVDQVREVGALRKGGSAREDSEHWLDLASDRGELAHLAVQAAVRATRAEWGVAHLRGASQFSVTCAVGNVRDRCLGQSLDTDHPLIQRASQGAVFVATEPGEPWSELMAAGLSAGSEVVGFALVPLLGPSRLLGVIELGRSDHPFRRRDRYVLERVALGVRLRAPSGGLLL